MNINQKLQNLPKKPGIYKFLNRANQVIYIGKAKNLRTRVRQYFSKADERPQIPYLLDETANIDYTVVNSELESLYLENNLIKQYHPKYNIELKDDKNYAFITIDYSTEIPQIGYARKFNPHNKQVVYFGPYSAAYKIRESLHLARKVFSFCSEKKVGQKPCFYFHLHRCPGVCIGKISLEDYYKHLEKIKMFLAGKIEKVSKTIRQDMLKASKDKKFEQAARLRDQLKTLEMLEAKQIVILPKKVDWDIVSFAADQNYACMNLFKVRGGKLQDKENFVYKNDTNIQIHANDTNILQTFLENYYLETSSVPKGIYLQHKIEDTKSVQKLIFSRFSKNVKLNVPQKGKPKRLIILGQTNAQEHLKNWLADKARQLDKTNSALNELKTLLNLPSIPRRIEAYDISNIQGTNAVGSMVVFLDGMPAKAQYRKFRIKTKTTPDDYTMMKEMLARRLTHLYNNKKHQEPNIKNQTNPKSQIQNNPPVPSLKLREGQEALWPMPNLMVIDGGKGQLNAALLALRKIQEPKPPSASRSRSEDPLGSRTMSSGSRGKIQMIGLAKKLEEIYIPGKKEPIKLSPDNAALQLLQNLRDEAHRFAITFHRKLRSKAATKSVLDDIVGVGPKTKKLLKEKFGTLANMKKTDLEELKKTVGEKLAKIIKQNL